MNFWSCIVVALSPIVLLVRLRGYLLIDVTKQEKMGSFSALLFCFNGRKEDSR